MPFQQKSINWVCNEVSQRLTEVYDARCNAYLKKWCCQVHNSLILCLDHYNQEENIQWDGNAPKDEECPFEQVLKLGAYVKWIFASHGGYRRAEVNLIRVHDWNEQERKKAIGEDGMTGAWEDYHSPYERQMISAFAKIITGDAGRNEQKLKRSELCADFV